MHLVLVSTRLEIGNKCTVGLNNTTDCSIRVFDSVCCSVCSIRLVDQLGIQMMGFTHLENLTYLNTFVMELTQRCLDMEVLLYYNCNLCPN